MGFLLVLSLGQGVPLGGRPRRRAVPRAWSAWRATLAAESDTVALLGLEQEKIAAAKVAA